MTSLSDYLPQVLSSYGIDTVFGIVGIPIVELADKMILQGKIRFIAFRNEQAASYAASAYGYLTGKPAVLLVVGGPGVIHALAGIYNSISNKWPLIVLAGSSEDRYKGGFQELDQVSLLSNYVKFSGKINESNIDMLVYNAMRLSVVGTPGVCYLDIPGDVIHKTVPNSKAHEAIPISAVRFSPDPSAIKNVAALVSKYSSKRVLCVIGKGAVEYPNELREFINRFQLPFLPTPMAKGVLPDSSPLNVSSARSLALKTADLVLVFGARLNWILHFGEAPKWKANAIFVQIDKTPEELGHNNQLGTSFALCGDIGLSVKALAQNLSSFKYTGLSQELKDKVKANEQRLHIKEITPAPILNYNQVYAHMRELIIDKDTILVTEGANTMDVARVSFPTDYPKQKLDAGTNATMGVGLGYAIAAKLAQPQKTVICIQGDSAFGFSAMELETASRNELGLVVVVMNNSGIYHGYVDPEKSTAGPLPPSKLPSTALSYNCRYDLVARGLGCDGYLVRTLAELTTEFEKALFHSKRGKTTVLNVVIEPGKQGKLSFGWQSKAKM